MLAAQGLATTCYALYKDSKSSIGPDEVVFEPPVATTLPYTKNYTTGRWRERVRKWEESGREGTLIGTSLNGWELTKEEADRAANPVGNAEYLGRRRDYSIRNGKYMLRPEVRYHVTDQPS